MHERDLMIVKVGRANDKGGMDTLLLKAPIIKVAQIENNKLEFMTNPTEHQLLVQKSWLTAEGEEISLTQKIHP